MTRPAIFITGAAAGIGRATARLFAAQGWFVGLYDIDEPGVRALQHELGDARACAGRLDVTDAVAFKAALDQFWSSAGERLDVMFNNAGIADSEDFETIALQRHQAVLAVNVQGVLNGCHLAFPYLRRTPGARVVNMSSASALYGTPGFAFYSATKFAVRGLTEALNVEWQRHGLRVMDILPLFVDTPMVQGFQKPPQSLSLLGLRLGPDDIARVVWRAAHSRGLWPRVHWLPNLQTRAMWLLQKLSPLWLNRLTLKLISGY